MTVFAHGTRGRRRQGCECADCRAVMTNSEQRHDGRLLARCWCDADYVLLTAAQVMAGVTYSCGRPQCDAMEEA